MRVGTKRPWRPLTTNLPLALTLACVWIVVGPVNVFLSVLAGRIWLAVVWGLYILFGWPWYITAIMLLKQRHRAGIEKARGDSLATDADC